MMIPGHLRKALGHAGILRESDAQETGSSDVEQSPCSRARWLARRLLFEIQGVTSVAMSFFQYALLNSRIGPNDLQSYVAAAGPPYSPSPARITFHVDIGIARYEVVGNLLQARAQEAALRGGGGEKKLVLAEIGVNDGTTSLHLLENVSQLSLLIGVDPFSEAAEAEADFERSQEGRRRSEEHRRRITPRSMYDTVSASYAQYGSRARLLRKVSLDAARDLGDEGVSLDAVFIEAAHDFEDVRQDLQAWAPLVKVGGIVAGHNYDLNAPGVRRAAPRSGLGYTCHATSRARLDRVVLS